MLIMSTTHNDQNPAPAIRQEQTTGGASRAVENTSTHEMYLNEVRAFALKVERDPIRAISAECGI